MKKEIILILLLLSIVSCQDHKFKDEYLSFISLSRNYQDSIDISLISSSMVIGEYKTYLSNDTLNIDIIYISSNPQKRVKSIHLTPSVKYINLQSRYIYIYS